jgi:hypothetical protein
MTAHGIERRRAPRARADFSIQVADRGSSRPAQVKDLSTNGLCCYHGDAINEMTLVGVQLEIPGDDCGPHDVQGAVVRCDKLRGQNPPTYEIAVYFTEITPQARRAIAGYVEQQLAV